METQGLEVKQQFTVGQSTKTCSLYKVIDLLRIYSVFNFKLYFNV